MYSPTEVVLLGTTCVAAWIFILGLLIYNERLDTKQYKKIKQENNLTTHKSNLIYLEENEPSLGQPITTWEFILESQKKTCCRVQEILKIPKEGTMEDAELDAMLLKEIKNILCSCGNCTRIGEEIEKLPTVERDGWIYKNAVATYNTVNKTLLRKADL